MSELKSAEQLVSFDEQLFVRTVEQITVFPDKLVFVFRDGTKSLDYEQIEDAEAKHFRESLVHNDYKQVLRIFNEKSSFPFVFSCPGL